MDSFVRSRVRVGELPESVKLRVLVVCVNRPGRVALFAGEGCLGIAVAASIATLNPNLNLPALPPQVNRKIAARRFRPSSTAKKATDGTVGVRARCAVYSVWIAHPEGTKF